MKFTIGNDIVEIEKLTKVYKSNPERFLLRVFNQAEITDDETKEPSE